MFTSHIGMNGRRMDASLLKGRDSGETHMTQIQEVNLKCTILVHQWCLHRKLCESDKCLQVMLLETRQFFCMSTRVRMGLYADVCLHAALFL